MGFQESGGSRLPPSGAGVESGGVRGLRRRPGPLGRVRTPTARAEYGEGAATPSSRPKRKARSASRPRAPAGGAPRRRAGRGCGAPRAEGGPRRGAAGAEMGARPPGGPGSRALARRARAAEPRPHPEPRGPALLLLVTPGAGGGGGGGRGAPPRDAPPRGALQSPPQFPGRHMDPAGRPARRR